MCARIRSACSAFTSDIEREWFRLLQTVQGVGTKVALAILVDARPADLASAIAMRDKAMVARTPGVGPKVAERIVTELKDKAPDYADIDPAVVRLAGAVDERRAPQPVADAVSALVNLGYGQPQAAAAIAAARAQRGRGRGDGAADPAGAEGIGEMTTAPRRLVTPERRDEDARRLAAPAAARRIHRPGSRRAPTSRCSSRRRARARRRSTMCCSSARRASARPRWRRSSRASSA